jgi:Sel1 repeat-containing protein/PDZ domain-containing protein/putative peptidoglycan binding protein
VRMPPGPTPVIERSPSVLPVSPQTPVPTPPNPPPQAVVPPTPPAPIQPAQPLGRTLKVPVRIGSLSTDGQKGWLGVRMETVELPFALSLGRLNADGALILEATAGGPAGQAGLRFGDIVIGYNGRGVQSMDDLRQQVSATTPGNTVMMDVWRVTSDDGDFLHTLRRLGEGGNAYIMYRLGRMYGSGIGVARDEIEAVRWLRKSANAGNVAAMTQLAVALLEGHGTGKDPQEAVRLLKSAADLGNVDAIYRLAGLLARGTVVQKDALEAVRLFTRAAEAGYSPAMVDLGLMFNNGQGVEADVTKAAMWYKRAADLGNTFGMVNLGFLYQQGKGVEKDEATAVSFYKRAANEGNPAGIHNLAAMYDSGRGVEHRDPEQAADLMLRSLELHNQFSFEQMTRNSNNWSRDFRRALQRKLRDAGFYTGRIDGYFREPTFTAINAYINRNR